MKKLLAVLAASVLALTAAFADDAGARSIHSLGFNTPIENQNWSLTHNEYDDLEADMFAVGFNIFYNHLQVGENRFAKIKDVQLGYEAAEVYNFNHAYYVSSYDFAQYITDGRTSKASEEISKQLLTRTFNLDTFNTRFMLGWGFAPVNVDRFVLSVNGTFGVGLKAGSGTETYSAYTYGTLDADYWAFTVNTFLGANCQAALRLGDSFGLTAGIHFYTGLVGFGVYGVSWEKDGLSDDRAELVLVTPGGFSADFKFGVCWMY